MQKSSTVLITGASSGIGLELAKIYGEHGCDLILVARDVSEIQKMNFGSGRLHCISKDLSKSGSAKELFEEISQKGLPIDTLINNAGFGDYGLFHESKLEKIVQMMQLNMITLVELTHLFLPEMITKKAGGILNVASTAAFQPGPLMSVYYATKAFVLSFTEGIAHETKDFGIRVTALCPGPTESKFQTASAMGESKLVRGKKLPTSAEVARYGYEALQSGKVVAIHGWMNALFANSVRFTPRSIVRSIVFAMQKKS